MKKLYFVRHGLTEMNVQQVIAGSSETPLTDEGRRQARQAGKRAKALNIDYIVASPLSRAHETAEIIAKIIGYPKENIHTSKLFVERDYGSLEGKPWSPDLNLDGFSDVETVDSLLERATLALAFLHQLEAEHILVVSHGGFGRALRSLLLQEHPYVNKFSNASTRLQNAEIHQWI